MYGWREAIQRIDAVAFGAAMGIIARMAYQMGWRQVVVRTSGIRARCGARPRVYPRSAVRQLVVRVLGRNRLLLTVQWADQKEPPLTICGPVDDVEATVHDLALTYPLVRE
jgi:hypothetical protein